MPDLAPKVLVLGAVVGHLRKMIQKVSKIHAKQDFSFAIIVGDVFSSQGEDEEELRMVLDGSLQIPLPVYFTVGDHPLPAAIITRLQADETNQVCSNLIFLGRKGIVKTVEGIRIVALGGNMVRDEENPTQPLSKFDPLYTVAEARGLYGAQTADVHILLTNQWPAGIIRGSDRPLPETLRSDEGTHSVSELCATLKPRYHFASSPRTSWEREPFGHGVGEVSSDVAIRMTRFRALASVDAPLKEWMAAFNLDPNAEQLPALDVTTSPFATPAASRKRPLDDQADSFSRYSYGNGPAYSSRPPKKHRMSAANPDDCFMCMNRPEYQAHMLVSIGNESAVTVPKGPLPLPETFPQLSSSGHALIIPFYHAADDLKKGPRGPQDIDKEFAEMAKYRTALCRMIQKRGQGRLGAVCWEANRTGVRHMHWQFMATPRLLLEKGLVEAAFRVFQENNQCPRFLPTDPAMRLNQSADFFRVWIWTPPGKRDDPVAAADEVNSDAGDDGTEMSMYFPIAGDQKFNLQFGREVMAGLLKLGDRTNWKIAEQSFEKEQSDAEALKDDFADFDFAMNA